MLLVYLSIESFADRSVVIAVKLVTTFGGAKVRLFFDKLLLSNYLFYFGVFDFGLGGLVYCFRYLLCRL
jgi:hypothetical protein